MKKIFLFLAIVLCQIYSFAQNQSPHSDSLRPQLLDSVLVKSFLKKTIAQSLPQVEDVYIYSGKKTTNYSLDESKANLAGNVARMAFSQVPGLNVWEMATRLV